MAALSRSPFQTLPSWDSAGQSCTRQVVCLHHRFTCRAAASGSCRRLARVSLLHSTCCRQDAVVRCHLPPPPPTNQALPSCCAAEAGNRARAAGSRALAAALILSPACCPLVAQLALETALAQWATAAHEDCLWVDHWKHEAARAAMDCIREHAWLPVVPSCLQPSPNGALASRQHARPAHRCVRHAARPLA